MLDSWIVYHTKQTVVDMQFAWLYNIVDFFISVTKPTHYLHYIAIIDCNFYI